MQTQEGMVNEGISLDASLDYEASTDDNTSTEQHDGSNSSEHAVDAERARVVICTDKAKTTRKRLKPGKHEHGNGRAHKEPGECY
ncbi:hypothetical protein Tco_0362440 [Tanacetum coccineum]